MDWKINNPCRLPKPPHVPLRVHFTTKINSNNEIYLLHLDEITCLSEYLSAIYKVTQASALSISKE